MQVMREETFGPVLPIIPAKDFDEALQRANQSEYGLGATLFSRDTDKVMRYIYEIEAGNVWVNDPIIDNLAGPFGGMKRSGIERELGIEGFVEFTETKHAHWDYANQIKPWWYPLE